MYYVYICMSSIFNKMSTSKYKKLWVFSKYNVNIGYFDIIGLEVFSIFLNIKMRL